MKTSETSYCAMDVAASIIHCSNQIGYGINYLHLQKLLYFVQAYSFILFSLSNENNEESESSPFLMGIVVIAASMALTHKEKERNLHPQPLDDVFYMSSVYIKTKYIGEIYYEQRKTQSIPSLDHNNPHV